MKALAQENVDELIALTKEINRQGEPLYSVLTESTTAAAAAANN